MQRCPDCNSVITNDEKVCKQCGAKQSRRGAKMMGSIAGVVRTMLWLSAALLAVSPFLDGAPNWKLCLAVTGILFFLSRTLEEGYRHTRR